MARLKEKDYRQDCNFEGINRETQGQAVSADGPNSYFDVPGIAGATINQEYACAKNKVRGRGFIVTVISCFR